MIDNYAAIDAFNSYKLNKQFKPRVNANEIDAKTPQDKALKEQTDAFESFLLKSVLDIALKKDKNGGLYGKDASDDIYSSMYNDTMSRALSGGLGFSKLLYDFLKQKG